MLFDISPILWTLAIIVIVLFGTIGGRKGLLLLSSIALFLITWVHVQEYLHSNKLKALDEELSKRCYAEAGSSGSVLSTTPREVVVKVGTQLTNNRLGLERGLSHPIQPAERVSIVSAFPAQKAEDVAYVEIDAIVEKDLGIKDLDDPGLGLVGLRATVFDSSGHLLARHINYLHREGNGCLGERLDFSLERFLQSRLRMENVLIEKDFKSPYATPIYSPRGTVSEIDTGCFSKNKFPRAYGDLYYERKIALIPSGVNCKVVRREQSSVCDQGGANQNEISLTGLLGVVQLADSWLAFDQKRSNSPFFIDALSAVERSMNGAVLSRWNIRLPRINLSNIGIAEIDNIVVTGKQFTADLFINPMEYCYQHKVSISVPMAASETD